MSTNTLQPYRFTKRQLIEGYVTAETQARIDALGAILDIATPVDGRSMDFVDPKTGKT